MKNAVTCRLASTCATARVARHARAAAALLLACASAHALAYTVSITAGSRALYLQVGAGSMTGGNFNSGGTPGNNSLVNTASVTVPATALGSGTAQTMTTDSTVTASPWDGFQFCNTPATTGQVYVGGFYRQPGGSTAGAATLTVNNTTVLTNTSTGATISFNQIAWTSSGNSDSTTTIPSGTFAAGASQTLLSVSRNTWFESCLAFRYLNSQIVPAGTFTCRATYTLTAP